MEECDAPTFKALLKFLYTDDLSRIEEPFQVLILFFLIKKLVAGVGQAVEG